MPATLTKVGDRLVLDLSTARGTEFKDGLEKIRAVAGRKYDPETKHWSVEADIHNAEKIIHSIQPTYDAALSEWVKLERVKFQEALVSALPDDAEVRTPIGERLYPFQRAFVDHAAAERRVLLGDDMGLGKTVQALASVDECRWREDGDDGPKLIACPNSVKGVWAREVVKWLGSNEPVRIIDGTTAKARHNQLVQAINENCFTVVNYEQLRVKNEKLTVKHRNGSTSEAKIEVMKEPLFELPFLAAAEPSLDDLDPRTVDRARKSKHRKGWYAAVADEVHRAKNRRSLQARGLHRVDASIKLGLSGTPLLNTPDELWSVLHWLWPEEYTSYWRFYENYVDYIEGYFGKIIVGVRNPDALRFELNGRVVRRTKAEVLDLPEKTRVIVPVTLASQERKLYEELVEQVWVDLAADAESGDEVLSKAIEAGDLSSLIKLPNGAARMVRLQQFLEHPENIDADKRADEAAKMDACQEIILDNSNVQHIVFTKYKPSGRIFVERLKDKGLRVGLYNGDVSQPDRTKLEDAFQAGELDVIVGTIDAMGEGVTLTAASTVHFLTRAWVPAKNEQAEDRAHREGQHDPVTIYIYEVPDTVDDGKIRPANKLKENIVKTVLTKDEVKELTL